MTGPAEFVLMAMLYAVAYVSLIIVLSGYLFEKREFK